jgi:hypothetical protein
MFEKVHDRTATGVTRVILTATVLRCGKQMEKQHHYKFPAQPLSKTDTNAKFFPWRQGNPEVNYSLLRISKSVFSKEVKNIRRMCNI